MKNKHSQTKAFVTKVLSANEIRMMIINDDSSFKSYYINIEIIRIDPIFTTFHIKILFPLFFYMIDAL